MLTCQILSRKILLVWPKISVLLFPVFLAVNITCWTWKEKLLLQLAVNHLVRHLFPTISFKPKRLSVSCKSLCCWISITSSVFHLLKTPHRDNKLTHVRCTFIQRKLFLSTKTILILNKSLCHLILGQVGNTVQSVMQPCHHNSKGDLLGNSCNNMFCNCKSPIYQLP